MKRLQVLFLVALSSSLLLFGCGDKEEDAIQPVVVEPITESQPEPEQEESNEAEEAEDETDLPPEEGMVRSTLTNEWISGDLEDARQFWNLFHSFYHINNQVKISKHI